MKNAIQEHAILTREIAVIAKLSKVIFVLMNKLLMVFVMNYAILLNVILTTLTVGVIFEISTKLDFGL